METLKVTIKVDGACDMLRECGCGAHVTINDGEKDAVVTLGRYIGRGTNNQAEYGALIMALDWLDREEFHNHEIRIFSDSQLIVNQVTGTWCVNDIPLMELNHQATELISRFTNFKLSWIRRADNKDADKISKQFADGGEPFHTVVRWKEVAPVA